MSTVVGAVIITRHGDRQGFYQSPTSYTASDTAITPLGEVQEYQSGQALQQRYLNSSSSTYIQGISWPLPKLAQLDVRADSSEGQVIVNSATAFMQGMWPANVYSNNTLANGTTITSPLGGFLYVPVETVEASEDISLEGYTDCPAFTANTKAVYASEAFKARGDIAEDFLASLAPIVNRNISFENMWNIFDYMNVEYIHDADFYNSTSLATMQQARDLANYHEHAVFTDPELDGIGNIAFHTLLGPILDGFERIENTTVGLKMMYLGCAYKPFLSLFNMTEVSNPNIVDYASVAVLEVHNSTAGDLTLKLAFRNGSSTTTDGSDLVATPMWGEDDGTSLEDFRTKLSPYAITDLGVWCNKCENKVSRGCDLIEIANASTRTADVTSTTGAQRTSPLVAGVIGAIIAFGTSILPPLPVPSTPFSSRRR
ncbi:histidine phosphatase superfamily [Mrakia frigida]|uniref:histidine phosphatase superfamily n=1 Tax=Mrakia frigida TaxID=29902 RepID=UPI003FCC0A06